MLENIEIKAIVRDVAGIEKIIEDIVPEAPLLIIQEDIFFNVPQGRLKLRMVENGTSELVFYERADYLCPKQSSYWKSEIGDHLGIKETLSRAIGIKGTVSKIRRLYIYGQTSIHLDAVDGLGNYLELEVMLQKNQSPDDGLALIMAIMNKLQIDKKDLIDVAYIDLLSRQ